MTIQNEAKSKKQTKYRSVERQDGVIVLRRQYRPSSLPPQQLLKFEKHIPTFTVPSSTSKPKTKVTLDNIEEELMQIGAQFNEEGRSENNDLVDAGRGGYNDPHDGLEDILNFNRGCWKTAEISRLSPMQRFLTGAGPWSPLEMRES